MYKHVLLGTLFLKAATESGRFVVPEAAAWPQLAAQAGAEDLAHALDHALAALETANPALAGTLPPRFAFAGLDARSLGELVRVIASLEPAADDGTRDTLGRVYEYLVGRFASAEGRGGGEFYTPACIVRLLVRLIQPFTGTVYDPCCGSGGMFVQSLRFVEAHGGHAGRIRVFGQESNPTTWRMAQMNLALHGLTGDLGPEAADTLHQDLHPGLRADHVLANPPFNISRWGADSLRDDPRWVHGPPPDSNANFAWLQHILHHLGPRGTAGVVLANGSLTAMTSGEGALRRALIEADRVEAIVALPDRLFYATQIPACLWILARGKGSDPHRDRSGEVLFIDASRLGRMETRVHRVLDTADLERVAGALHRWRDPAGGHQDEPGFACSVTLADIAAQDHNLTPGRYVGPRPAHFETSAPSVAELVSTLRDQRREAVALDQAVAEVLHRLERP